MTSRYLPRFFGVIAILAMVFSTANAAFPAKTIAPQSKLPVQTANRGAVNADTPLTPVLKSHRLIVELESPPLAAWAKTSTAPGLRSTNGRLNAQAPQAQAYIAQLRQEQATFVAAMQQVVPGAAVSTFINEFGAAEPNAYQVVFNGMAIDPGTADIAAVREQLAKIKGVRNVAFDYGHTPDLQASNPLINAPTAWNSPAIGGRQNAGAGIKFASMDGGVHKDAPMFSGAGYSYPAGFPPNGLGLTANNNGKIIASRTYFRPWDMPSTGDENPWPGTKGTSHGVHTSGIAAGNVVTATYQGLSFQNMSGVAPRAWVMSYRVFYNSVTDDGSFYDAEGIAALEDIAVDGADVLNNSWGGGPGSTGGEYDALDTALINVTQAGTFVSMSAGNAGPGQGTTDHPSDEYINVAASSTASTLVTGSLNASGPMPISPTLQTIPYGTASFGAEIPSGSVTTYPYVVPAANKDGCSASIWPASSTWFTGTAVLIERGGCEFGVKVLNAENSGAEFVVIYNNVTNGDVLGNMGPGAVGNQVTISSVLIGRTKGLGLVNWFNTHGASSEITINTVTAYDAGNIPDRLAGFSSRGPGVGEVLKPDITAPGVNILSQGYTPGTGIDGEDRHLGYGQASGTSMAAPQVAGAAVLLRQMYPTWSNSDIKSAMMSTSKYLNVFNIDNTAAQPLDMGAGRLDLAKAIDPGVILSPPSLSFGRVISGTSKTIQVTVRSIAATSETYNLSTLYTGAGFNATTALPGFSVTPASITLAPGASTTVAVTINTAQSRGYGDNQGFIILDGPTHDAHMAAWARVSYAQGPADVLIIDNDASNVGPIGVSDYLGYYTQTLTTLGYSYNVLNATATNLTYSLPHATVLSSYKAIIYFTGDNYYPDGYTVPTGLTLLDMDRLTEYANGGGTLIAMGQDLAAVLASDNEDPPFFYGAVLGGQWLRDSITEAQTPTLKIQSTTYTPPAWQNVKLDVGAAGDGAGNQFYIDELKYTTKDPNDQDGLPSFVPFLKYPYTSTVTLGTVGMMHSQQPTLERPGITFNGRTAYTSFGLEGVNNSSGNTTRAQFLDSLIKWGWDRPTATINNSFGLANGTTFVAALQSPVGSAGVSYRWDFGDGSAYTAGSPSTTVHHNYAVSGVYTVRLEATDAYGNKVVVSKQITAKSARKLHLPVIRK